MLRFLSGAFFMPRQDFERMVMQEGIAQNCFALSILLQIHFIRCKKRDYIDRVRCIFCN